MNIYITKDQDLTLEDLSKEISTLKCCKIKLAKAIRLVTIKLFPEHNMSVSESGDTIWGLYAVLIATLQCYDQSEKRDVTQKTLDLALQLAKRFKSFNSIDNANMNQIILGMSCSQTMGARSVMFDKIKTNIITELVDFQKIEVNDKTFFDDLFIEKFGTGMQEYSTVLIYIIASSKNESYTKLDNIKKLLKIDIQKLKSIFDDLTIDHFEISDFLKREFSSLDCGSQIQAMSQVKPIIRVGKELFLAPDRLCSALYSEGLWNKVLELGENAALKAGKIEPKRNKYARRLGENFEKLLKFSLEASKAGEVQEEFVFKNGANLLSPDMFFYEKANGDKGELATVFECKVRRLGLNEMYGTNWEDFENALVQTYAKSIWQPLMRLYDMETSYLEGCITSDALAKVERILNAKQLIIVGVMPLMPPIFQFKSFREMVERQIEENLRGYKDSYLWWKKNSKFKGWHILDTNEILYFLCYKQKNHKFFKELKKFLEIQRKERFFIKTQKLYPGFTQWYHSRELIHQDKVFEDKLGKVFSIVSKTVVPKFFSSKK